MQIFISSALCYQPAIVIKKRGSQSDHNKRLPLYIYIYIYICVMLVNVMENTSFNSQASLILKELKYCATIF